MRDVVASYIGGGWGKDSPDEEYVVPAFVVRGTDFSSIVEGDNRTVPARFHKKSNVSKRQFGIDDIVFEVSGGSKNQPVGRTVLAKDSVLAQFDAPVIPASFCKRVVIDKHVAVPAYVYYFLASIYQNRTITQWQTQSTGLSNFGFEKFLDECEVTLPPLPVQSRIASILSAYDELIENNQRRIRILETMARALYREWFIEFRFPGHENVTRVASSLGDIPEGWKVNPLESLMADYIGGGWGKETGDDKHTKPAWVIRGTDIPDARNCQVAGVPYRFHAGSNIRSRRLLAGDILFEVSGGSKGQPVGRTLLVTPQLLSAFGDDPIICASFCKRIRPDAAGYGSELLYLSFVEGYTSGEIEQFQVQSTGISNFKWTEYIGKTERAIPPEPLRVSFRELVAPLFSQIGTLGLTIQNLRRTRDLLLPRLLSGQVALAETAA